jgi:hypothetical protein
MWQVKIGDFGFAKRLQQDQDGLTITRLTHPRWTAPEVCAALQQVPADRATPARGHLALGTYYG